jgi:hypothetical protein
LKISAVAGKFKWVIMARFLEFITSFLIMSCGSIFDIREGITGLPVQGGKGGPFSPKA